MRHDEAFKLSEDALRNFDMEFRDWPVYADFLQCHHATGVKRILDIGGGNGDFLDRLLHQYPGATAVLVDNAEKMIRLNKPNDRKQVFLGTSYDYRGVHEGDGFDLITINVLLHHLVAGDEETTRSMVLSCLDDVRHLLAPGGRVVVYEAIFDPMVRGTAPGERVFQLTSIRHPILAKMLRSFGANTAGVGVRFRSVASWRRLFSEAGFRVVGERLAFLDTPPLRNRLALNIGRQGAYLFALEPSSI